MNWVDWLKDSVNGANKAVFDLRTAAGTDMGSTLVMAVMDGLRVHLANVGDSRAYLVNKQGIQRVSTDHSLVERLIATGQIRRDEGRTHPQRNVVYRTIGDKEQVDADVFTLAIEPGDRILLCSDGLWEMLEDETTLQIIRESANPQAACEKLVAAANTAGGEDNITALLIEAAKAE
jgi:protein phosphatase